MSEHIKETAEEQFQRIERESAEERMALIYSDPSKVVAGVVLGTIVLSAIFAVASHFIEPKEQQPQAATAPKAKVLNK